MFKRRRKKPDWDVDWFKVRWTWRKEWWVGYRRHMGSASLKSVMGCIGLLNVFTIGLFCLQIEWRWPQTITMSWTDDEIREQANG